MKKTITTILIAVTSILYLFSACSFADKIPAVVYLCATPYKRLEYLSEKIEGDKIEINGKIIQVYDETGPDDRIFLIDSNNGETLSVFYYKYNSKKEQLILTDRETGNRYYLNKIEYFLLIKVY